MEAKTKRKLRWSAWMTVLAIVVTGPGCSCGSDGGAAGGDGGIARTDGRVPFDENTDECGNGVDDDADERIDEGCFCAAGEMQGCYTGALASRGVGSCGDGMQACEASGSVEWGTWGACVGAMPPGEQACDGTDGDCDGAIDEGCPCTAGDERACGATELSAPCQAGTQRCTDDGSWSSCEGAIGPESEVCDDGVDNDCDGTVDDPTLCACRPEPERCGDGVDNDCDGAIDEPDACSTCEPETETCDDGGDEDCDGRIDEGCDDECDPALAPPRLVAPMSTSYVTTHRPTLSWDGGLGDFRARVCADRACTTEVQRLDVTGQSVRPATLAPGVYFWNVASLDGATEGCPSSTWELVVRQRDTPVDTRFGTMLDLNGDGLADVLVAAKNAMTVPGEELYVGRVFVYDGTGSGVPSLPSRVIESPWTMHQRLGSFGGDFESAGDVNGDGYGDVVIGAQYIENVGEDGRPHYRGRAWVFHGGPTELGPTELAPPARDTGDRNFGVTVAGLGDVDGDGYGDVAIGSGQHVRIYFGTPTGVDASAPFELDLPSNGFPTAPLVSAGCDTNGDGFADLIVGDARPGDFDGRAYVWEGSAAGYAARPDHVLEPSDRDGPGLGFSVGCAGDVNGDGYADLVSGAPGVRSMVMPGRVYVFHGSAGGVADRPSTTTMLADQRRDLGSVVTGVGDVNGDGYDDVIASMRVPPFTSRVFAILGSGGGLGSTPDAELTAAGVASIGFRPQYLADLNGDGAADVLTAAGDLAVFFSSTGFGSDWNPSGTIFPPSGMGDTTGFGGEVGGRGSR